MEEYLIINKFNTSDGATDKKHWINYQQIKYHHDLIDLRGTYAFYQTIQQKHDQLQKTSIVVYPNYVPTNWKISNADGGQEQYVRLCVPIPEEEKVNLETELEVLGVVQPQ